MSTDTKRALIPIMTQQYEQIAAIEAQWGIRFKEGDMRPRIEYFHDAVRALSSGTADLYAKNSRLSVEYLAYDLASLREVQAHPLGKIPRRQSTPTGQELLVLNADGGSGPSRGVRAELKQLYKDYTVLFAALFAETADINFKSRSEEVDTSVSDLSKAQGVLKQVASGAINPTQARMLLDGIEMDGLREKMQQALSTKALQAAQASAMIAQLKGAEQKIMTEQKTLDKAHLSYVTGQLAVYQESKDTVKRLAAQGMNLAGKFVQNAMNNAGKGQGKGV